MPQGNCTFKMHLTEIPEAQIIATVTMSPPVRARLWIALGLIRLAGWVLDWNVEIKESDDSHRVPEVQA